MRRTLSLMAAMAPGLLLAQFDLNGVTISYRTQQDLLAEADTLFLNGNPQKACAMYSNIFSGHELNWQYAIREIRCQSLVEKPNRQMVEYLYSKQVNKYQIAHDTILGPYMLELMSNIPENPFYSDAYNKLLDSLHTYDQGIRIARAPLAEIDSVDSINFSRLKAIYYEKGNEYMGSMGSMMILIHALYRHPKDMPFIIDLLNKALLDGIINPQPYAVILDEAFYSLCGCVPFGVFGDPTDPLPTCAGADVARLYRARLLGQ